MADQGIPPGQGTNTRGDYCGACGGPKCRCKQFDPYASSSPTSPENVLDKVPLDKGHSLGGGK